MSDTPHDLGGKTEIVTDDDLSRPDGRSIRKFAFPSLLGILTFLTPIRVEGNWTILMGYISDTAVNYMGAAMPWIVFALVCVSATGTLWASTIGRPEEGSLAYRLFHVAPVWIALRVAGLVMGAKAFNTGMKIVGAACGYGDVSVMKDKVRGIVEEAKERYDLDFTLSDDDLIVYNQYAGDGYGIMSEAKLEAVKLLAETEGIMIDPVYTSVAMACIIDQVKQGNFKKTDNVVFLHTGGAVALFPYKEPLRAHIQGKPLPWKVPGWSPQSG